ncbi:MAG: hypothetical protein RIQ52_2011 [Pseudomonadota bacterium]
MKLSILRRLLHIQRVLLRHGLDDLVRQTHLFPWLDRGLRWLPGSGFRGRRSKAPRGVRLREALEELGPIFVKFGQALSTRRDLLPEDIAAELVRLQDRVPPFTAAAARKTIEKALGEAIENVFASFEPEAMASASVAQVHAATLPNGDAVVVKVLRPGIEQRIDADIELLETLAAMAERYWPEASRLHPSEVVAEFARTIRDELDLVREAANAQEIRRRFENSDMLYIPKVYWDHTRRNVMVMERVSGLPIGDVAALRAAGVDLKLLAERGVEIFFTQVFRDNFFHADMHPGNIFATREAGYIAVDFGIVASLSPNDQYYLAENFLAFFNRDYLRVAEMHIQSGWVPATTRIHEFEAAIRSVCEPIFEKPLGEISYGHLLLRLFQVARRFDMEVQPQLVLFQKTLLNIEGLGRELYPQLDLWKTAKPFLENWFREQLSPRKGIAKIRRQMPQWARQWPQLPDLAYQALSRTAQGELEIQFRSAQVETLREEIRTGRRQLSQTIAGAALLGSSFHPVLAAMPVTSGLLLLAGIATLLLNLRR